MRRYPWFRLWHEARTDKKLGTLSDAEHRVWFNLLCYASEQNERGVIDNYDPELLALEVAGGDVTLCNATVTRLVALKVLRVDTGRIEFINWQERQYDKPSDQPERVRERVAKHRANARVSEPAADAASVKRDVTPCNAVEERRGEEKREEKKRVEKDEGSTPQVDAPRTAPAPKHSTTQRASRIPEDFEVTAEMLEWAASEVPGLDVRWHTEEFRDYWRGVPGQRGVKLDWVGTWRNAMRKAYERIPQGNGQPRAAPKLTPAQQREAQILAESEERRRRRVVPNTIEWPGPS